MIVAHSERREYFHETEETALKKIGAALEAGLTPIYCVGERLHERESDETHEVLGRQLRGCVGQLTPEQFQAWSSHTSLVGPLAPAKWLRPRSPPTRTSSSAGQIREQFGT